LTQHVTCSLNSSVQTAYIATYSVLYAYSTLYAAQNNVLSIPAITDRHQLLLLLLLLPYVTNRYRCCVCAGNSFTPSMSERVVRRCKCGH
jgi:hypothetical protein